MSRPRQPGKNSPSPARKRTPPSSTGRHPEARFVVPKLTHKEDYRSFYLKKTTWEAIRYSRGWGKGAISRFAEELHVTRQYAWDLVTHRSGCSTNVMGKIIEILGLKPGMCWCHLFDRICMRNIDVNHPIFNQQKYMGETPYMAHSPSAELRSRDYSVEKDAF